MSAQQEAVALFKHLESRGFRPSVRFIGRTLRSLGLRFTEASLRAWLQPFVASPTQQTSTNDATPTRLTREKEVSLVSEAPSLFGINPSQAPKQKRRPKSDTSWLQALESSVDFAGTVTIAQLTPEQRLLFARLFAAWYEHRCADEGGNRRRGIRLAASFARMATIPRFGSLTCDAYSALCERYLAFTGGKPFHDPFAVQAVMELVS